LAAAPPTRNATVTRSGSSSPVARLTTTFASCPISPLLLSFVGGVASVRGRARRSIRSTTEISASSCWGARRCRTAMNEAISLLALAAILVAAVTRPRWAPDWVIATLAALVLLAVGAISFSGARSALRELGPTVGFLAALLLLADGCRRAGMFDALVAWMA